MATEKVPRFRSSFSEELMMSRPAPELSIARRGESRVVGVLEQARHPAQGDEHRAAARLRWVRGEDRVDPDGSERLACVDTSERGVVEPVAARPRLRPL